DGGVVSQGCLAGSDVLWDLGTIAAGTSRGVQLVIQIYGQVPTGTILSTTARLEDAAGARARAVVDTVVQSAAPLSLVLTTDADPVPPGDDLEYTLRFGNDGANALLSTQLSLTLPAGTTVVDAGGGSVTSSAVTWSLGALNAGQA